MPEGIEAQTEATLANVERALGAVGLDLSHVLKSTVHLAELDRDFAAVQRRLPPDRAAAVPGADDGRLAAAGHPGRDRRRRPDGAAVTRRRRHTMRALVFTGPGSRGAAGRRRRPRRPAGWVPSRCGPAASAAASCTASAASASAGRR